MMGGRDRPRHARPPERPNSWRMVLMYPRDLIRLLALLLALAAPVYAQTAAPAAKPQTPAPAAKPQLPAAAKPYEPTVGQEGKDVVWVPTPQALVDKMLEIAKVTPQDFLMDLGSGDGRTV